MEDRTKIESSDLSSDLSQKSPNQNSGHRIKHLRENVGISQKAASQKIGIAQSTIQRYEQGSTPKGDHLIKLCSFFGVSADWLLFGEGEIHTVGDKCRQEPPRQAGPIYNGAEPGEESHATAPPKNIGDLVSKTIEVLQSQTVFETALTSNIEAFHHAISLEKKIDNVEDRIMNKISKRLDDLESDNKKLRRENKQLRDEIQRDRDQSVAEDTG